MKQTIKGKWELQRARKYTKLLLNGSVFQQWFNEDIDLILKTSDFQKQVEYFRNHLKG
jgi:hypothetical protein